MLSLLVLYLGASVAGATGLVLALPVFGVVAVIGEAVAQIVTDERLMARYRLARQNAQRNLPENFRCCPLIQTGSPCSTPMKDYPAGDRVRVI